MWKTSTGGGYVPLADIGAEFLCQVIAERAERAALIVTTKLPFSEWTQVFPNPRLCKALLDRITDRAHIIETGTESYRFHRTLEVRQIYSIPLTTYITVRDPKPLEIRVRRRFNGLKNGLEHECRGQQRSDRQKTSCLDLAISLGAALVGTGGRFVVLRSGEAYDAQARDPNRKFQFEKLKQV
jgi:hypothetical protein